MDAVQAVRNRILQLCEEYDLSINRLTTLSALQKVGNYSAVAVTSAARPMPSMRRGTEHSHQRSDRAEKDLSLRV